MTKYCHSLTSDPSSDFSWIDMAIHIYYVELFSTSSWLGMLLVSCWFTGFCSQLYCHLQLYGVSRILSLLSRAFHVFTSHRFPICCSISIPSNYLSLIDEVWGLSVHSKAVYETLSDRTNKCSIFFGCLGTGLKVKQLGAIIYNRILQSVE
jgi:hypothetical protein